MVNEFWVFYGSDMETGVEDAARAYKRRLGKVPNAFRVHPLDSGGVHSIHGLIAVEDKTMQRNHIGVFIKEQDEPGDVPGTGEGDCPRP